MRSTAFWLAVVAVALSAAWHALPAHAQELDKVLGICDIDGKYYFGTKDALNQSADEIVAAGCHTIKVEMSSTSRTKYSWNSTWPANSTLKALAQTTYFDTLFKNPNITTYVITTYCPTLTGTSNPAGYWYNGPNQTSIFNAEQQQFNDLATYLLTNPAFAGKTFILEQWEGDQALGSEAQNHGQLGNVPSTAIQGMIAWINARAAGIHAAVSANPSSPVKVYASLEVNLVKNAMYQAGIGPNANEWNSSVVITYPYTVTGNVLPNVNVDKVSYSAYDTMFLQSPSAYAFSAACAFIVSKYPSRIAGTGFANLGVGEFGIPEGDDPTSTVNADINIVLSTCINNAMPYCLYWEMYSNELETGAPAPPENGNNSAVKGFYMIRPDGSPATAWHQWRWQNITTNGSRTSSTAIKSGLTLKYTSAFPSSGSALGTGWSLGTFSGDVSWTCQSGNQVKMQVVQNASAFPYGVATLNVATVTGKALVPGNYVEYTMQRLNDAGFVGAQVFNTSHGSGQASGSQPLQVFSSQVGNWIPISFKWDGTNPTYNFDAATTFGFRLDSADGTFATISFYVNGSYSGSYIYQTTATSLSTFSLFAQCNVLNDAFVFSNVQVYQ